MYAAGPGVTTFDASAYSGVENVEITNVEWYYLINAFYKILVSPFMSLGQSWVAVFLIESLNAGFYFFGVHGTAVMGPVINVLWSPLLLQNVAAFGAWGPDVFEAGWTVTEAMHNEAITNPALSAAASLPVGFTLAQFTDGSQNGFCMTGGAGSLMALLLILSIFSKVPQQRTIANIALPTSVFNISEPTLFGLPVALNPVYWFPYTFAAGFQGLALLWITKLGLMNEVVVVVPWTAPLFLNGFLGTLDWRSFIWTIVIFAIAIAVYLPFALADIKQQVAALAKAEGMTVEEYGKYSDDLHQRERIEAKADRPIDKVDNKLVKLESKIEKAESHIDTNTKLLEQYNEEFSKYIEDAKSNLELYKNNNDDKGMEIEQKQIDRFTSSLDKKTAYYNGKIQKFEADIKAFESEIESINKNEMPPAEKESEKIMQELTAKADAKKAATDAKLAEKRKNKELKNKDKK